MNLRDEARNRECQVRLIGVCNWDRETTVLAHFRMQVVTRGLVARAKSTKVPDILGAWACSDCHAAIDSGAPNYTKEQLRLAHLEGVARTIAALVKEKGEPWT